MGSIVVQDDRISLWRIKVVLKDCFNKGYFVQKGIEWKRK